MRRGFFITGTDTGVGKTIITGAVISALKASGTNACGMKPLETGCRREGGKLLPEDGMFIKDIAGMADDISLVAPCCFETPAAPLVASGIEDINIDLTHIISAFSELSLRYDCVVAEGAGGILVPIKRDYFMTDLIRDMGIPAIVVTRPSLGAINHSLLTVRYAVKEGIEVAGIIINFSGPPDNSIAERTNPEVIEQLSPAPLLGIFPHLCTRSYDEIRSTALKHINTDILRKYIS